MTTQQASNFEAIYNPDGTCGARYDCGKQGVVLVYDPFSPEVGIWFCREHWSEYEGIMTIVEDIMTIVEDRRLEAER